jgi:hypothetical protein
MQRIKEGGKGREGGFAADSRTSHLLQEASLSLKPAQSPWLRHGASAGGNLRTSCVQRMPVDTLSRWEALRQARGDRGLRPLRHVAHGRARHPLPWEVQPRVLILGSRSLTPPTHLTDARAARRRPVRLSALNLSLNLIPERQWC